MSKTQTTLNEPFNFMREFINQIDDDVLREKMESALLRTTKVRMQQNGYSMYTFYDFNGNPVSIVKSEIND